MKAYLKAHQDLSYKAFIEKLVPNIEGDRIIGIRVPLLRKKAKEMKKEGKEEVFFNTLPHTFYEENLIHAYLLNEEKDLEKVISLLKDFIPYVDNWAVCDSLSPKLFKKEKDASLAFSIACFLSDEVYTKRFGILNLMRHFLEEDFKEEHLALIGELKGEDYYLKMAKAWYFAEAFAKQYEKTYVYFKENKLDLWVHNKGIQKALESQKLSKEKKEKIKALRRKNS